MDEHDNKLEVTVYLIDGSHYQFFSEDEAEIDRIYRSIQPNRVFGEKQYIMAGTYYMSGFAAPAVTRIDFVSHTPPSWPHLGGVKEITEISEEALDRRAIPRQSDPRRSEVQPKPGETMETFADFGLADGSRLCVKMTMEVHGAIDQRSRAYHMFTGPGFHVARRGGGVILVNPRHIIRWSMYPGPAQTPTMAWRLHRIDPREWGGAPSKMFEKMDMSVPEDEQNKQ